MSVSGPQSDVFVWPLAALEVGTRSSFSRHGRSWEDLRRYGEHVSRRFEGGIQHPFRFSWVFRTIEDPPRSTVDAEERGANEKLPGGGGVPRTVRSGWPNGAVPSTGQDERQKHRTAHVPTFKGVWRRSQGKGCTKWTKDTYGHESSTWDTATHAEGQEPRMKTQRCFSRGENIDRMPEGNTSRPTKQGTEATYNIVAHCWIDAGQVFCVGDAIVVR